MRLSTIIAAMISTVVMLDGPCSAQMPGNVPGVPQRELVVGTKADAAVCNEERGRQLERYQHRSLASRRG